MALAIDTPRKRSIIIVDDAVVGTRQILTEKKKARRDDAVVGTRQKNTEKKKAQIEDKSSLIRGAFFWEIILMKIRCFTPQFYKDKSSWSEMLSKETRPYLMVEVIINNCNCYIPLRSHVMDRHVNCFPTVAPAGLDLSKAIFLTNEEVSLYIDTTRTPTINTREFRIILNSEKLIKQAMISYISEYKNAKKRPEIDTNKLLIKRSTLQYFERFIY